MCSVRSVLSWQHLGKKLHSLFGLKTLNCLFPGKHQHKTRQLHKLTMAHTENLKCKRLSEEVVKSDNDPKDYRVVCMENGLTALLISDKCDPGSDSGSTDKQKAEKMAAAALAVGVGSFSDPADLPGLAHFLEHMVFMGSEKYPNENEFDEFVKKHGGYNNAYTDAECTVFYFNIEKDAFRKGLDIFSGFFTKPLLKQDSVDRECKAVDSEFCMSKTSDGSKREQLLSRFAKTDHPMGKFTMGSIESLKETPEKNGIDVYSRLKEFHKKCYSAQYMTLILQATYPLDTLEEWATEIFSAVPSNQQKRPTFYELKGPFDTPAFTKLYRMVPNRNEHRLEITWSLPTLLEHYRSKPLHYLGFLLGHEGKGSIMAYLRKRLWAVEIVSGNSEYGFEHNTTQASFTVNVLLTEKGLDCFNDVIFAVMMYVEMLRKEGPQKWIFEEIQNIEYNSFKFTEENDPMDNVESLCPKMLLYPADQYITGSTLYFEYNPQKISECVELMRPEKANIILSSKRFESQNVCNLTEPWYKTKYSEEDIPEDLRNKWKNMTPDKELHLPNPNIFIASDFELKPQVNLTEYPVAITDSPLCRLWFKQDTKFKLPKAEVKFILYSAIIKNSAKTLGMFDLFVDILEYQFTETAYAATMAGLSYTFMRYEHGLVLAVEGFNHKLLKLFESLVDFIAEFKVNDELLETMKINKQKKYYNKMIKSSGLNMDLRLAILRKDECKYTDLQRDLPSVTAADLNQFVKDMTSVVYVEGLCQGNLTMEEAKCFETYLLEKLKCRSISDQKPENVVMEVPCGELYVRTDNLNAKDENSSIVNYYQYGPANMHQLSLNELLTMRMEEPCFAVLRTKLQLGYSVYCTNRVTDGILALSVTVQSQAHKFSLEELDGHIENFLKEFDEMLASDCEEDFDTMRNALIVLKKAPDSNLGEEFGRNWGEIREKTYLFDSLKRKVKELESLTLSEFREWYKSFITIKEKCRKLSIQVEGHKHADVCGESTEQEPEDGDVDSEEEEEEEEDGEENMEEEAEEDVDLSDGNYIITDIVLKPIENKPAASVINDIKVTQDKNSFFPVSRIM